MELPSSPPLPLACPPDLPAVFPLSLHSHRPDHTDLSSFKGFSSPHVAACRATSSYPSRFSHEGEIISASSRIDQRITKIAALLTTPTPKREENFPITRSAG